MIDLFAAGFSEAQRAAAQACRDMAHDIAGRADPSRPPEAVRRLRQAAGRILELNMLKGPKA